MLLRKKRTIWRSTDGGKRVHDELLRAIFVALATRRVRLIWWFTGVDLSCGKVCRCYEEEFHFEEWLGNSGNAGNWICEVGDA